MLVRKNRKIITNWLLIGVFMVVVQFLLGGITRLTGSGLSITEWKPIMGFIPPTTDAEWNRLFELYRNSPQFKYLNYDFTLPEFKFIFFWEWIHRFWARLMGLVFLIPFIYFLYNRSFTNRAVIPFTGLFVLGMLQGAIGWIMVMSGLEDTEIFVGHIELATHFITAVILMMYLYGLYLTVRHETAPIRLSHSVRPVLSFMLILILLQLFWGGLMAGMHAGTFAATWPDINGQYFPLASLSTWSQYIFFEPIGIHLVHRSLAYLIFFILLCVYVIYRATELRSYLLWPFILVFVQIGLGISTVLLSPQASFAHFRSFEWMALSHQTVGLLFALSVFRVEYFTFSRR